MFVQVGVGITLYPLEMEDLRQTSFMSTIQLWVGMAALIYSGAYLK